MRMARICEGIMATLFTRLSQATWAQTLDTWTNPGTCSIIDTYKFNVTLNTKYARQVPVRAGGT